MPPPKKDIDIVIFGATGFTGQLVAEYFAEYVDWNKVCYAVAGRNGTKLVDVVGKSR